eukprot:TRINITY_DN8528_c0_g1_i5.p1 TRINITY_DN8528_c0_g1~~TRINITY_DN8528_c0_g1_i5.p1  ORF type:complete len:743 (-),score=184.82 TRINITY_DN8528_c0_g1_i5:135-2363(-)
MNHQHRPTGTKQSNKSYKSGKHRSKGQIKRLQAGKVNTTTRKSPKNRLQEKKQQRKNRAKQFAEQKRQQSLLRNSIGRMNQGPPRLVAIVPLGSQANVDEALNLLLTQCEYEESQLLPTNIGGIHAEVPRFKTRLSFYKVNDRETNTILDMAKVADVILFVVNIDEGIDEAGETTISLLKNFGLPSVMGTYQGLNTVENKKKSAAKKLMQEILHDIFPNKPKMVPMDTERDSNQAIRFLCNVKISNNSWKNLRPYMFVEKVNFEPYENSKFGTLALTGYLRGTKLNVNNLIVFPDYGEFQLLKIETSNDPHRFGGPSSMEVTEVVAEANPQLQQTLEQYHEPDFFASEQTWPTPQELMEADMAMKTQTKVVPKGVSGYQAIWIPDDYAGDDMNESSEEFDVDIDVDNIDINAYRLAGNQSMEEESSNESLDSEEKLEELKEQELEDFHFPDEVDTPIDVPASVRFQKYRGLKSFRATPWDPFENLPVDYAKIFQFENVNRTRKRVFRERDGVEDGSWVTLYVKDVASDLLADRPNNHPLVVGGILKYENQMSVMNFHIMRHPSYEKPLPSKQELTIHCGFRRYLGQPVFSENSTCDKFKYMRFLRNGSSIATVYAPISFNPCPVAMFDSDGALVATGNVKNIEPNRVILKKIIICGAPVKINKNRSIIKGMFFTPEDIRWFKPVELWTKYGRTGHIKEAVGTHGQMKCVFDGQLISQDTVCMSLYKRVFPKWAILPTPERLN